MWFIIILATIVITTLLALRVFNYIQLEGYRPSMPRRCQYYTLAVVSAGAVGGAIMALTRYVSDNRIIDWLAMLIIILPCIAVLIIDMLIKHKTPLKLTKRMTRLICIYIIIVTCIGAALVYCGELAGGKCLFLPILTGLSPFAAYLALFVSMPMENVIKNRLVKKASEKIKEADNLIKIGITGSYGKTSVKSILTAMLQKKYNVVASRHSYNTPMGAVLTARELDKNTEVLIMEMGARRPNDIKELCDIVKPDIGVITGIAPQHLATFKTIDNVIKTKYELIASLPREGVAFFNGNDDNARRLFYRTTLGRKYISLKDSGYVYASEVKSDIGGLEFNLHIGENVYLAKTKLLGRHNVENILLCANIANYLGVTDEKIVESIAELEFAPHRMELIKSNGVFIIDDSYNCNTVGAKRAIETIAEYPNRKIVATQGIVELGSSAREENYKLGLMLSGVADTVFAIGINGKAITEGLMDGGYNPTRIINVDNLDKAQELFGSTLTNGDVLLLMNDLPDNY